MSFKDELKSALGAHAMELDGGEILISKVDLDSHVSVRFVFEQDGSLKMVLLRDHLQAARSRGSFGT